MPVRSNVLLLACFVAVLAFLATTTRAQLIASRDLTLGTRVPADRLATPQSCQQADSSIDAPPPPTESADAKALQLTITALSPAKLAIGEDFTATVRLKNVASTAVLVPSVPDGERVVRTSADGTEEKYEVGDLSFRLLTGKTHGIPTFLDSGGALFADPDDKSSYISLAPGNWIAIKVHAAVECGVEECLGSIRPDTNAVLTAWWYQRVLTHKVNGCNETHGSLKIRELDSAPFTVPVEIPKKKNAAVTRGRK